MITPTDIPVGNAANMTPSILINGKLKLGIYQIQNLAGQTAVEMQESSRTLCCRPAKGLSGGDGLARSTLVFIAESLASHVQYVSSDLSLVVYAMLPSAVGVPTFWTWLHHSKGGARIDSGRLDATRCIS